MGHVCLRNPFLLFLFGNSKHPLPTRSRFLRAAARSARSALYTVASCPSLRCSCRKKPVSCREAERLVMELWSPRFVTMQPFSCRCWQNATQCRKEICSTCLFKKSIPAIPFGNSKHPLSNRSVGLSFYAASLSETEEFGHLCGS